MPGSGPGAANENNYGLGTPTTSGPAGVGSNGHHQQRSPEKKYRIKTVKQQPVPQQVPQQQGPPPPPPPMANAKPPSPVTQHPPQQQQQSPAIKPQLMNTPGAGEGKPRPLAMKSNSGGAADMQPPMKPLCPVQQSVPPPQQHQPPHVPGPCVYEMQQQLQQLHMQEQQQVVYSAAMTAAEQPKKFDKEGTPSSVASSSGSSNSSTTAASSLTAADEMEDPAEQAPAAEQEIHHRPVEADLFGLYSLTFVSRSKDLSDRKVRMDFERFGEVSRVRGQFAPGESVIVSYTEREPAEVAVRDPAVRSKYGPSLQVAPRVQVVPDKDGHWSIDFSNSRMASIREITQDFSRHGEVCKVMFASSGSSKGGVKRVTVSYAERQSAFDAVNSAHDRRKNKDFTNVDFAKECLLELASPVSTPVNGSDPSADTRAMIQALDR